MTYFVNFHGKDLERAIIKTHSHDCLIRRNGDFGAGGVVGNVSVCRFRVEVGMGNKEKRKSNKVTNDHVKLYFFIYCLECDSMQIVKLYEIVYFY